MVYKNAMFILTISVERSISRCPILKEKLILKKDVTLVYGSFQYIQ